MVVYVDDILIFSPSSDLVKEVMLKLQDKFKCKTLGLRKGVAEVLEAKKTPKHKVNTKIHPLLRCNLALDPLGMSLECLALTSSTRRFMVVYVDDILIFSPSSDLVKEVMLKLQDKFKCKTLGDVKWHWVRSMVTAGEVELHYVKTTVQPADMMTKRLVEQQHWKCCKLAGMALN
ncbi:hypothetical protein CLOM_g22803 [Closterium sp. NIES-68]|nr:hypothetical protein CLOM_g22803 [Closterium sp. NIES-68]